MSKTVYDQNILTGIEILVGKFKTEYTRNILTAGIKILSWKSIIAQYT